MDELSCSCLAKAVAPTGGATDIESHLGSCSFRTQEVEPENQDTLRIKSFKNQFLSDRPEPSLAATREQ